MPMTVFHEQGHSRRGERCSTAAAYLEPALANRADHPHLSTLTGIDARRVVWSNELQPSGAADCAPHAAGIEFVAAGGQLGLARAKKEVILSAGAIASPQLLQLSGVGPQVITRAIGAPVSL